DGAAAPLRPRAGPQADRLPRRRAGRVSGDDGGGSTKDDAARRNRDAWEKVRSGGRLAFHVVLTVVTMAVCVGGEAAGNLLFHGGADLADRALNAAIFGFV